MVDIMLDFMLGPMRNISQFYFEHQIIFNPLILIIMGARIFMKRNKATNEAMNHSS